MSAIIEAWRGRTPREQVLLGGLGVIVVALVLWYGAYKPLTALAEEAQARHRTAAADLEQVQALAAAAKPLPAGDQTALTAAAQRLAGEAGVPILRQEPGAGGSVGVWTEAVATRVLFAWLSRLQAAGVGVREFEAHKGEGGLVDARVVLVAAS